MLYQIKNSGQSPYFYILQNPCARAFKIGLFNEKYFITLWNVKSHVTPGVCQIPLALLDNNVSQTYQTLVSDICVLENEKKHYILHVVVCSIVFVEELLQQVLSEVCTILD